MQGQKETASTGENNALKFTDELRFETAARRFGSAFGKFDLSWIVGPGDSVIWNATDLFDESAAQILEILGQA